MSQNQTQLTALLDRLRLSVPTPCRPNFNAVAKDFSDRLSRAVVGGPEYHDLATKLWQRIQDLENLDLASLPPHLYREPGEPVREYLARCYAVAEGQEFDPPSKRSHTCRTQKQRRTHAYRA